LRLKTIGGLWIEAETPLPPLGPRQLGLLALVAAAGKRGVSRDRVIGILWPESEQEPARHTLSQMLYRLKRETGRDWISATPELRLDPGVSSDVGELLDALAGGDLKAAAELYSGSFLDGFFVPGAAEFERWAETERSRLHMLALRAIEQLADQADQEGRSGEAIRWWHRLTELDPLSARYAAGHMRALAGGGDRARALAQARIHQDVVRRELDVEVDPAVRQLEATLRKPAATSSQPAPAAAPAAAPALPAATVAASPARLTAKPFRLGLLLASLGAAALIVAAALRLVPPAATDRPVLAVGAIRVAPDTTSTGPVLRDMLATGLGGVEGLQVVANSRLLELTPRGADTVAGSTSDAARRAGAAEVIEGEMLREAAGFVLTLRRVALASGVVRRGYVVRAQDPYDLVDSATAVIARDFQLAASSTAVRAVRTASPEAYLLYEEGLRAYYQFDTHAAYRLMTAALQRDSSFAMAAYWVWQLGRSQVDDAQSQSDLSRAKRLAPRAIDRERLLIQGSAAELDGPVSQRIAIAETLSVRYPEDPDGQYLLGAARFHAGDWPGSVAAYNRAVALDSVAEATKGPFCRVCATLTALSQTYVWWDSLPAAEQSLRRLIAFRPEEAAAWINLVEPLLRQGRRAEAEVAFQRGAALTTGSPTVRGLLNRDLIRWGRFEEADRELLSDLSSAAQNERAEGRWLMLISLRNQGRLREALALARDGSIPGSERSVRDLGVEGINLAVLALELGRWSEAARLYREISPHAPRADQVPGHVARVSAWMLTLAGLAHAMGGDTAAARRLVDTVETLGRISSFGRDARLGHFLRGVLLQREGWHREAVEAFRRSLFSTTDGLTRTNLLMARSLLALGRAAEAIAILRPALRGGVDGSNTHVTHTELREELAHAFEQAGQRDSATYYYRAVERAWRRADSQFRERYERAKAKVGVQ